MSCFLSGSNVDLKESPLENVDHVAAVMIQRLLLLIASITRFYFTPFSPPLTLFKGDHDRHCSPGWHYAALGVTPHCYYLSASIQRNYQGNIAFCSAERAQPLRIDGPSEQDWLTETARNLIGTDKLWTGGNKADPNSGWNWFEWPSFPYVNWDSSQPNTEKDFITMNTANGKWQTHEENEV